MCRFRPLAFESLQSRHLLDGSLHNALLPSDVNGDGQVTSTDVLAIVHHLNTGSSDTHSHFLDVNDDGFVSPRDGLVIINHLNSQSAAHQASFAVGQGEVGGAAQALGMGSAHQATFSEKEFDADTDTIKLQNLLTAADVETLLSRASMATRSNDAIIAVVDRSGRILGVRVEEDVAATITDEDSLGFAIDGAVAKARTAAFFSSNAAPLTSRTVRFISQSTITQREVESSPLHADARYRGPGFVAPVGVGGHFPPEIPFTPQVDLFAIEHQSRDSQTHPGPDGVKGGGDDFELLTRFNADPDFIPELADAFFATWPESYGEQSGRSENSIPRGIATLPGGIPLYKIVTEPGDPMFNPSLSEAINLVGGIGVFFPGEDGFATHEQGFVHHSENGGRTQTESARTNAAKVLESESAAFIAAAGGGLVGPKAFLRNLNQFNAKLPDLPNFVLPIARIDLVGITLEIYGPTPSRAYRKPGVDRLVDVGRAHFMGTDSGTNQIVEPGGATALPGQPVPEGWLVAPHDAPNPAGLTEADVIEIIERGIAEAHRTRAAIRLNVNNNFRPGATTRMVFAVADTDGNLLGLYRMPDATVFSIDVSIAKARNTAYYADPLDLVPSDRVDFDGDGDFENTTGSTQTPNGDTFPLGTALTNRSFRFLVEPRFPTGSQPSSSLARDLANDASLDLCDQHRQCVQIGPQSMLRLPGINPLTAENIDNLDPLAIDVYASSTHASTLAFDAFHVMRNFRDPGDAAVEIAGTNVLQALANQNGVVFFPGSTPLYVDERSHLAGGFGVSGDGVDQDDVVTSAGQRNFDPLQSIRVDSYTLGGVRIPFQKFNRNPFRS